MVCGFEFYWKFMSKKCFFWLKVGVLVISVVLLSIILVLVNQFEIFVSVDYFQGRQLVFIEVEMFIGGFGNIGFFIYQGACLVIF